MRRRWGEWSTMAGGLACVLAFSSCERSEEASASPEPAPVEAGAEPESDDEAEARRERTELAAIMASLGSMFDQKRREGTIEPQLVAKHLARVEAFLARDRFYRDRNRGMAYMALFLVAYEDPDTPAETIERAVAGMAQYDEQNPHIAFSAAPRHLAERYGHFEPARAAIEKGLAKFDPPDPANRPEGDHGWLVAKILATRAVIEAAAGDVDAAEEALAAARKRGDGAPAEIEEAAGRVALARGDEKAAEQAFVRGLGISPNCRQCREGLEQLHARRGGKPDAFEAYLKRVTADEVAARRKRLLAQMVSNGPRLPSFELRDLDGRKWSSKELEGKVVVLNFWTLFCGPCEREMPALEQLIKDYADDARVVILTVGADATPDALRAHLEKVGVELPTLVATRELFEEWNVSKYPTTWLVDRKGRIAAAVEGTSPASHDELTWRIERLWKR